MRTRSPLVILIALACLATAGCGGGGGGGSPNTSTPSSTTVASATPAASSPVAASSPPVVPQSTVPNVQPVAVQMGVTSTRNMLTTSVTVCTPGTSSCATIDNVQVDTGSQGLRILASALPAGVTLPAIASGTGTGGECAVFGSGYAWGAVRRADVRMAGEVAASLPVQVIADASVPTVPAGCSASGLAMQSASALRANGILGVGVFSADCGGGCVGSALPRWYYTCDATGACQATAQALADQVTNPVSSFASDNNGVVIDLPAVPDAGASAASGSLVFGIGTQADNGLGSATVLTGDSSTGYVKTASNGSVYAQSFVDSGSNGLFFSSTTLTRCGVWYCPGSTQVSSATMTGINGASVTLSLEVANAQTLFSTPNYAFNDLAGAMGSAFDWGLPFFFGRRIYTAIETRVTPAGTGPYYAF